MQSLHIRHGQAVTIDWLDSKALGGWQRQTFTTPGTVRSLGYVVATDDVAIAITTSIEETGCHYDPLSIPWGCITRIDIMSEDYSREGPAEPLA
jgi:hypothetical protein